MGREVGGVGVGEVELWYRYELCGGKMKEVPDEASGDYFVLILVLLPCFIDVHSIHSIFSSTSGFSLGLNDRAQRPVVLFSALSFFLSALSFFQRPVIFREPFGFFGLSSALF